MMNKMSWPTVVVVVVLSSGVAFFAGRSSRPAVKSDEKLPTSTLPTSQGQANSLAGDANAATSHPATGTDGLTRIQNLRADLRQNSTGPVERLNELQALLKASLKNNTLTPTGVIMMFKEETDASILDVLQGVLAANPDYANAAGVTEAFVAIAQADPNPSRRQTAIAYLGTAWDKDGKVKDVLLGIVRDDQDMGARMSALGTIKAYTAKNWTKADAVSNQLLQIAQTAKDSDVRAEAVNSLDIHLGGEKAAAPLLSFLADTQSMVRLAAAEKLGDAAPTARPAVVNALEQAVARETESHVREIMLTNLVKAGRGDAEAALDRMIKSNTAIKADAQDYLTILRGGYVDWTDISRMKGEMEESRGR